MNLSICDFSMGSTVRCMKKRHPVTSINLGHGVLFVWDYLVTNKEDIDL